MRESCKSLGSEALKAHLTAILANPLARPCGRPHIESMAIYHLHMGYISRKGGRSATAHAAYIGCTTLTEARTGLVFDYSRKKGLLHGAILAPEGCPEWVHDREQLWIAVEAFEDHIAYLRFRGHHHPDKHEKSLNARETYLETCKTAFTAVFALPLEIINPQDQIELSERIIKACYVQKGLIADYAIHGDEGNPHLHILATTRPWIEGSFSKRRYVLEREQLVEIRHFAASIANEFASEKGYNYVLDARSYADQGLKILPSQHIGSKAYHKYKGQSRIDHENFQIHRKNLLKLFKNPEDIIKVVATQKVVFTQRDIEKEIFKRVGGDMTLYSLLKTHLEGIEVSEDMLRVANDNCILHGEDLKVDMDQTLASFSGHLLEGEDVISLGRSLRSLPVFTTKQALELEESVYKWVKHLCNLRGKEIPPSIKESAILRAERHNGFSFSKEQKQAINYLLEPTALRVLTGKAGTGKTTVLKPVVEAYKNAGYIPLGTAFQGKVSELLSHDLQIPSYTLDQLRLYWGRYYKLKEDMLHLKGKALQVAQKELERLSAYQLTDRHVVILDEGNMVGGNLWQGLFSRIQESGAHLRIVQDNHQIKALYGADIARLIEDKAGHFELKEVHRQKEGWMREASAHLNNHDLIEGMKPYEERGFFTFKDSLISARYALTEAYVNHYLSSHQEGFPNTRIIALAFQNSEVENTNAAIRHQLKEIGFLGKSFSFKGKEFAIGDRVIFTQNDHTEWLVKTVETKIKKNQDSFHEKGIKNGTFGNVESFDEKTATLNIRLSKDDRLIRVNLKTYDQLEYGYAMTVNKAEGQTFDSVYGLFDPLMNANKTLIWMTRHRDAFQAFISREHATDLNQMAAVVGRSEYRPLIADFGLTHSLEAEIVKRYMNAAYKAGNLWGRISRENPYAPSDHSEWDDFQVAQHERNYFAGEILEYWEKCRTFVHQVGLKKITLEIQAGLRQRELNEVELEALRRVEDYQAIAIKARTLWNEISPTEKLSKNSPTVREHQELIEKRNIIAYEIMSFPALHHPFFKISRKEGLHVSYGGQAYEKSPPSLKAAKKHAEAYIRKQHQKAFTTKLTSIECAAFEELLTFKRQVKECGRLGVALKAETPFINKNISSIKIALEESSKERDFLAFKIVKYYERYGHLLERAGVSQDQLLKYAVFGEARQLALKHKLSKTIEQRLEYAEQLLKMVGEGDTFDKPLYAILKDMGVDHSRLKFEQGWLQEKNLIPHKNIEELRAAFISLNEHKNHFQDSTPDWKILKTSLKERQRIESKSNFPIKAVEEALRENMAEFADTIFASLGVHYHRSSSSATERRYGKKGHIAVNLRTGAWIDYKDSSLSGGPLHMLTKLKGLSFKEVLNYGASWARIDPQSKELPKELSHNLDYQETKKETSDINEKRAKIEKVKALWEKGKPIQETIAERYLKEHRKIQGDLPEDLRFLPAFKDHSSRMKYSCLMAAARSLEGEITGIQLTFLDSKTGNKTTFEVTRKSFGILNGGSVTIQAEKALPHSLGEESPFLFIAEGVETALSIKEAGVKGMIKASLGLSNIKRLLPENPKTHIVICADNDAPDSPAAQNLAKSVLELQEKEFKVTIIKPEKLKEDFNDVLKLKGKEAIRAILQKNLPQEAFKVEAQEINKNREILTPKSSSHKDHDKISSTRAIEESKGFLARSSLNNLSQEGAWQSKSFNDIEKHCQHFIYDYAEKKKKALTPKLKERLDLQAEKAANFIFHAHTLKETTPTDKEIALFLLRAKYELDHTPQIQKKLTEEWQQKGHFDDKKDPLLIRMIAERQATIEGRLYFEAKQKERTPSSNISALAIKEFNEHRAKTKSLAQNLAQKYKLSETTALHCAENLLRYKETHGERPTTKQIAYMAQISLQLEGKYITPYAKEVGQHNIEYMKQKESDSMFRELCEHNKLNLSSELKNKQQDTKQQLEAMNKQAAKENFKQKEC